MLTLFSRILLTSLNEYPVLYATVLYLAFDPYEVAMAVPVYRGVSCGFGFAILDWQGQSGSWQTEPEVDMMHWT